MATNELAKRQILYAIYKAMEKYNNDDAYFEPSSYTRESDRPSMKIDCCKHFILDAYKPDLEKWEMEITTICYEIGFKLNHITISPSGNTRLASYSNLFFNIYNQIWDGEDEDEDGLDSLHKWTKEYLEIYGETIQ